MTAFRYDPMEGREVPVKNDAPAHHSDAGAARPPEYSDDALALAFADSFADDLRFVAAWHAWLAWDGIRWRIEKTRLAYDKARAICREAAGRKHNKERLAAALASAKTVAAVERLASADRRLAATVEQWDVDAWLLNTPEGAFDLRTGAPMENRPGDYVTKATAVAPGGDCPLFRAFLARVTDGDQAMQDYLQRVFGYCLTGSTEEHALFFFHGSGSNGKSVLLETVAGILADYTTAAPMETFTASRGDRHPTDLAKMRGARLVSAVETEEGRQWAEAKIKALTGGDKVTARFMRGDFFDYVPAFKLVIAGNHKPRIRTVDEAIRRRFNLVPFTVTIPAEEQDKTLAERLQAEWPGILQWMIDGCADWQERGLAPPKAVTDATAEYLESEDAMAAWLVEECEVNPAKAESSSSLYASWKDWTNRAGEWCGSQREFSQKLAARGFEKMKTRTGAQFVGLALNSRNDWNAA